MAWDEEAFISKEDIRGPSSSHQHHQPSTYTWDSQITRLNHQSNLSSTCQAAGGCCTEHRSQHHDGGGEAVNGAEMMSLQCI